MNWKAPALLFVSIGLFASFGTGSASAYKLAPGITGARITAVAMGSPAQRVGLEAGDIIVAIDNQPVRAVDDFPRLIGTSKRVSLVIRDVRTGRYNVTDAYPSNGRLGLRFVIAYVPEVVLPPFGEMPRR
jgi:membrane-associated protease RseP (regulator of RpoE activity)